MGAGYIRGISAFCHESAASLVRDGEVCRQDPEGAIHPEEALCALPWAACALLSQRGKNLFGGIATIHIFSSRTEMIFRC